MSQFLRDALFLHMTWHIERGVDFHEAFILGVAEIQQQLRGSSPEVAARLIEEAKRNVLYARETSTKVH